MLAPPFGRPRRLALLALLCAPCLWPAEAPRREAVVVTPVEDVHSAPSADSDVTSQAFLGQSVTVLEERAAFARVELPDRYAGWLRLAALRGYPDASTPRYASRGRVAEVVSLIANVYREPSVTSARPKSQAPATARLELVGEPLEVELGWLLVRLPSGESGYVQAGDVRLSEASAPAPRLTGPELVAQARRFLGLPYLWGGMTPWGVDCSGFVAAVYRSGGRILPRDADLQFENPGARAVEPAALEPGDLVFFGRPAVSHVGLYAGEGRFVHATTHERPVVQESRLDDPHWRELYRGARRPR
jgi:cell wall-associated NlpC family hydrolase